MVTAMTSPESTCGFVDGSKQSRSELLRTSRRVGPGRCAQCQLLSVGSPIDRRVGLLSS